MRFLIFIFFLLFRIAYFFYLLPHLDWDMSSGSSESESESGAESESGSEGESSESGDVLTMTKDKGNSRQLVNTLRTSPSHSHSHTPSRTLPMDDPLEIGNVDSTPNHPINELSIDEIANINQQFSLVKSQQDSLEFGFEGIKSKSTANHGNGSKVIAKQKTKKRSTSKSAGASSRNALNERNEPNEHEPPAKRHKAESKKTDKSKSTHPTTNQPDPNLWNARKDSKTKYLAQFFQPVSNSLQQDGKFDVICSLCPDSSQLRVTKGNNSNLLKHLKSVI